ncbi:Hok/Gef family protein (plasmid) [Vibrio mediterranei]|uniref:Hok/Gef family protein n=1 Tax=Vibrio mediterranei TaxID=689 RepID=A0A3G4VKS7_9VIBR|nr:Hok/Gef family protein [Vibrio mediterranei]
MIRNLIIASYLTRGKFMSKKPALVALLAFCCTAVLLTALFRGSLCELNYKSKDNNLRISFAYEAK